ncbi:MAG: hypothetical protein KIG91_00835 [Treponema sp.]|nr:hypothetical protein [Treponema sp.]
MTSTQNVNPSEKYKDRLFRAIFDDPEHREWLLSLYNAVNNSHYTNVEDLEVTTLDDVIYTKMKNDISFLLNSQMSLYEHQSSYSPNLPLRGFLYYADLLRLKYHDKKLYSTSRLNIATPNYVVFYNGPQDIGEKQILKLSDSFEIPVKNEDEIYEWTCTMLNINKGKNEKLMESCKALKDYSEYVSMVRGNLLSGEDLNTAVENALDEAVSRNFLNGYFEKYRARIKSMSLTEYDEEEAKKVYHDEGYMEGMAAQKAEDEKIIQEKDAEIARILEENARMKALLETKKD